MSDIRIALDLVASAGGAASVYSLIYAFSGLGYTIGQLSSPDAGIAIAAAEMLTLEGIMLGAAADSLVFDSALKTMITDAANLQYTQVQMGFSLHGTAQQIAELNPLILQWADNSIYTSAQIQQLVGALSQHGLDVTQIINGDAQAAINMAEAMGIDPVQSANLLASALQMFSDQGYTAAQTSDILTGAFYNGVPSASELQSAFNAVGGTADTLGIKLPDLAANIDVLAQAGLSGSEAGTSLRYILQAISDPTTKAAADMSFLGLTVVNQTSPAFERLKQDLEQSGAAGQAAVSQFDGTSVGLNAMFKEAQKLHLIPLDASFNTWATASGAMSSKFYDAKGNFIGLGNSIMTLTDQIIAKAHGNKELELQLIEEMFNVRSGRAAQILVNMKNYKDHYNSIISQIGKTSTSKDATQLVNTLSGSWAELNTTFTSFMATAGKPLLDFLTHLVQGLNGLISGLMKNHPVIVQFLTIFAVVGAVLAPLVLIVTALAFAVIFLDGALLPFILLAIGVALAIAIIAAVIAGVILLIMHWGQVTKWLGQEWKQFTDWLGSNVHKALTAVGNWFSWLGTEIHSHLTKTIANIKHIWDTGIAYIKNHVHAFVQSIVDKFEWLYHHNYYFQELVDTIKMKFYEAKVYVEQTWHHITQELTARWNGLVARARGIWATFTADFHKTMDNIKAFAHYIWQNIVTSIQSDINVLATIGNWIYTHVTKPIEDKFTSLASDAFTWGKNLLTGFGNGLASMEGWLKQQAINVLGPLAKILGFHSPAEEGPGADADTWAPNLMKMYAAGIAANTGLVTQAALGVAGVMQAALTQGLPAGFAAPSGVSGGNTQVTVQVGNEPLFQLVMNRLTGQLQFNGVGRVWR